MTNIFLSLPVELLLTICNKLYLIDLKSLRLSCKLLAERLSFLVLSNIHITAKSIEDLISRLRFLTNPPSAAVNCTTEITIRGFRKENVSMYTDTQKIRDELFTAVTSLKAVRTVRWFPRQRSPLWFQESIWSAIGCLPALRTLFIRATFLKINLENLNTFLDLESISIYTDHSDHLAALLENVSKLYACSTNLISIDLDIFPDEFDLCHLLACRPKVDVGSRLRHLALCNLSVRINENTLHHLVNLTSLKLSLPDVGSLSSSPDEIWNAFRMSKIHLQELDIEDCAMGHAVNDYLSSFIGLEKLRLYIDQFDDQESLDASAVKFWSDSFLNHVDTLQDFGVRTYHDNQWCFGDHNRSVIAKCTKLKHFMIRVSTSDIPRQELDPDGITPLIETVLTHMPLIEHLDLDVPLIEDLTGASSRRLTNWILKYEPASSFRDRFAKVDVFQDGEIVVGRK